MDPDDREQIRAAALRYSRGVDRLDAELMKSAYWPDALDDHGTFVGSGHELCDRVVRTHTRYVSTMHCVLNHAIEPDESGSPDVAYGEVYNVTYLVRDEPAEDGRSGRVLDTWCGRYLDRYERRTGVWRIAHRTCVCEWTRSEPITAAMPIAADRFRAGAADRGTSTPIGR